MSDGELKKHPDHYGSLNKMWVCTFDYIRDNQELHKELWIPISGHKRTVDEAKKELENNVVTTLELWRKYQYCLPVDSAKQQWVPMSVVKKWFGDVE